MNKLMFCCLIVLLTIGGLNVQAEERLYKPFVLASNGPGELVQAINSVKRSLLDVGFIITGEYSPYEGSHVLVATNYQLISGSKKSKGAKFAVPQRVAVSQVGEDIQVAYANPEYFAQAYQMKDDMKWVSNQLAAALGRIEEFGSKGMTRKKLRKYHYTFGMEYFRDIMVLAEYGSYGEAISKVEKSLSKKEGGAFKISRIDIQGENTTIYSVGMTEGYSSDQKVMSIIDYKTLKHTAHLPYELIVKNNKIIALHPRFRIAIDFPELSMSGIKNSFMQIISSPDAIKKALTLASGGECYYDEDLDEELCGEF